ncbi:PsbP-like protein 2 [Zostera marina]|uniref:PsbP-like protein 2 n=1 Tax=Zostera marina TaxID=29655 RepID=A0A0K9PIM7_ZOSMR|nr:PsbP-like protein 2 [Zostera marina]
MTAISGGFWTSVLFNKHLLQSPSNSPVSSRLTAIKACSREPTETANRRLVLLGAAGTLASSTLISPGFSSPANADELVVPNKYQAFVDRIDGYRYFYPADWRNFDFLGHDSAFKDRIASLQHVRVNFIPTNKTSIYDLGPMEVAIPKLVKEVYASPNQVPTIYEMKERSADGKNYWTFEFMLESPIFARTAFATIAVGNGRYYTLIVGANERRWKRVRNQLKVVADSFELLDI